MEIKQHKQIEELRHRLEKTGWRIVGEVERAFNGKPKWEIADEIPHLVFSWEMLKHPMETPFCLDFIAWGDPFTYETYIQDCAHCQLRGTPLRLDFYNPKQLKTEKGLAHWQQQLEVFIHEIQLLKK